MRIHIELVNIRTVSLLVLSFSDLEICIVLVSIARHHF